MKELLEKVKSLDKRILIGAGITVAIVVILCVALLISGSRTPKDKNSENGTESGNNIIGSDVEGSEGNSGTEQLGTEFGTEFGTELDGTEIEGTEVDSTQVEGTGVTTPSGKDIIGSGTAADPYLDTPDMDSMILVTIEVPAGKSVYYGIYRVGNMYLSIDDADAYVVEANGTKHSAQGGKVGFTVENAMANEYVLFQIGNNSSTAKSFTLRFSNVKGSYQNPEKVSVAGQYTVQLPAGEEVGYHYQYTAEKKGTIRFYIVSQSSSCSLSITNKANSANRTFEAELQEDAKGKYVELEAEFVSAGDEILIVICADKYRGEIPAASVTWEIVYVN